MWSMKRQAVGVFTLGGTIAMTAGAGSSAGVVPGLDGADLVSAVPGLAPSGIDVEVHDLRQLPSASLGFGDLVALVDAIEERFAVGAITGAVVTQGTDTIEETGWLIDLLHTGPAPIVVTGAMRHPGLAGADGSANLLAAVQVAASPQARELGALVVFADDVFAARDVRKTHTTSVAAFAAPNTGPLGHVSEGAVAIWSRPARVRLAAAARVRTPGLLDRPRVGLLPMSLGQDDVIVRAVGGCLDGLVVAGFGAGHVPAGVAPALAELALRMPVVLASRTGAGPVTERTYAYAGSEFDLLGRGLIRAGYLDPYKARVLLQVLLAAQADDAEVRRAFADIGGALVSR
jgi:L-asparaginase